MHEPFDVEAAESLGEGAGVRSACAATAAKKHKDAPEIESRNASAERFDAVVLTDWALGNGRVCTSFLAGLETNGSARIEIDIPTT